MVCSSELVAAGLFGWVKIMRVGVFLKKLRQNKAGILLAKELSGPTAEI